MDGSIHDRGDCVLVLNPFVNGLGLLLGTILSSQGGVAGLFSGWPGRQTAGPTVNGFVRVLGSRATRVALWGLGFGAPILGLSGELAFRTRQAFELRHAAAFRLHNPNAFVATGARLAEAKSLWKVPAVEYRPGAHLELTISGEDYIVDINKRGFRTREFSEPKPAHTLRVVCIGGSTTVAGRSNDLTYPAILEKALLAAHPSTQIEVLNLGVSGARSDYWLKRLDQLFSYEPDVVVQYDGVNDILFGALPAYARIHPWKHALYRSLLLRWLLPIGPKDLDGDFLEAIGRQALLDSLCRRRHVHHVAGSFAGPDYAAATREMQANLDVGIQEWTAGPATTPVTHYPTYAELLSRYNGLFQDVAERSKMVYVPVHKELTDPALFVDLCHLTQDGIARLAAVFVPAVASAVDQILDARNSASPQGDRSPNILRLAYIDESALGGGWSPPRHPRDEESFRWALSPVSCVRVPVGDLGSDVELHVRARAPRRRQPQRLALVFNGKALASAAVPLEWTDIPFLLTGRSPTSKAIDVCLRFENMPTKGQRDDVVAAVAEIRLSSSSPKGTRSSSR